MEEGLGDTAKELDANLASIVQNQEQFIYRMAEWRLRNLRWNPRCCKRSQALRNQISYLNLFIAERLNSSRS